MVNIHNPLTALLCWDQVFQLLLQQIYQI